MLRRQEGCSNMMGVSGLHPGLWAYCEGATLPPALGGMVPGQWAQCALLWFQRSQLQPPALCSTASTHNTTKPNPEMKIRNLSSLLLCIFFFSITRREREGKPVPLIQTLQLWLEKKDKGWRIPLCSPLSAGSILMTFPPSISITRYTSSTQGFPLFSLIRNFRIFLLPSEKLLFLFFPVYQWPFSQQKYCTSHCQQMGTEEPCWGRDAGYVQEQCLENSRQYQGGRKECSPSGQQSQSLHYKGWHPLSAVWGMRHSLAPQDTVNKKLLSLESQQDNDGRRLGLSNERNSPSEPCWATKPRGQKMETSNLVGWRKYKKINPQKH